MDTFGDTGPLPAAPIDEFLALDMRVGTVLSAKLNARAHHPAYVLEIDFGDAIGTKTSSAQVTDEHRAEELVGQQVIALTNLSARRVAGVSSEVLVLAAVESGGRTVLVQPAKPVENGARLL